MPVPADREVLIRVCATTVNRTDCNFKPVTDRHFQLEDIVNATRYVETGQKTGNVLIIVRD